MTTVAETIAAWCASPPPSSPKSRKLACEAIADTLACLYAGRDDDATRAAARAFGRDGGAPSLLVTGGRQRPSVAAMINGTAAHALDFDDNFTPGMSHPSAVIVPALLALLPHEVISGRALIDAYLVALQAQAFVGSGVAASHYTAGWHGTSTIGSIGTAAGTARLLGLDEVGIAAAMTLGASMASGTKGQFGAPAKPFHAGMAARNAVDAALLAAEGLRGRGDILEGPQGFLEMFGGESPTGYDVHAISMTRDHVIETEGLLPKLHPCCGSTHLAIDALFDLMAEEAFDAEEVVSADCHIGIANYRNLAFSAPTNGMEARFSMNYCLALALRYGRLSLADFTPDGVARFSGDPLLGRVRMTHYTDEEERKGGRLPHRLRLALADGRILERARPLPRGGITEPFTEEERRGKFRDCLDGVVSSDALYESLLGLDEQENLTFLRPFFPG